MIQTIISTITKDLSDIESLENPKLKRKECSLLISRITSAKKLIDNDVKLLNELIELEKKSQALKGS
jgi:hypothetical protein